MCITMQFEWDEQKNCSNQTKHGVAFELAELVFLDPLALFRKDSIDGQGEQR